MRNLEWLCCGRKNLLSGKGRFLLRISRIHLGFEGFLLLFLIGVLVLLIGGFWWWWGRFGWLCFVLLCWLGSRSGGQGGSGWGCCWWKLNVCGRWWWCLEKCWNRHRWSCLGDGLSGGSGFWLVLGRWNRLNFLHFGKGDYRIFEGFLISLRK